MLSGNAVLAALKRRGVNAEGFDPGERAVQNLASEGFDRAWNALHGPGGEDGLMQGALEWLGIPYTGSGVLASALTMDKLKTKRVVVGAGLAAPPYAVLADPADLERALKEIGLPMMVKPASQGSSVGITKVKTAAQLAPAYAEARSIDPIVFAERFITGDEFTVGVLNDRGLPSIRIQPATEFYDYQAKYFRNDTQYHCPSGLDARAEAELQSAALATFRVTDCERLGARGLHARGGERKILFHRDQHDARHDRPQSRAHGGAPRRNRLRRAGVAGSQSSFVRERK